jgi:hypothetical protein
MVLPWAHRRNLWYETFLRTVRRKNVLYQKYETIQVQYETIQVQYETIEVRYET